MTEQRRAEAGATWQSEPIFQEKIGNPITVHAEHKPRSMPAHR